MLIKSKKIMKVSICSVCRGYVLRPIGRSALKDLFAIVKVFSYVPSSASFSFIFGLFKQPIHFLQQSNVKKCPYSIRCQDSNSQPPDQGSRPTVKVLSLIQTSFSDLICKRRRSLWTRSRPKMICWSWPSARPDTAYPRSRRPRSTTKWPRSTCCRWKTKNSRQWWMLFLNLHGWHCKPRSG